MGESSTEERGAAKTARIGAQVLSELCSPSRVDWETRGLGNPAEANYFGDGTKGRESVAKRVE
jgi:hypothetical protein